LFLGGHLLVMTAYIYFKGFRSLPAFWLFRPISEAFPYYRKSFQLHHFDSQPMGGAIMFAFLSCRLEGETKDNPAKMNQSIGGEK
jgi:hypothetical protein